MGDLSNLDRTITSVLRRAGVLVDLELDAAMGGNGQAVCMCSDGDQLVDHVVHQIRVSERDGKPVRLHTFALHGGGMLLSPDSGLYTDHDVAGLLHTHFVQAESPDLKGIDTAVLSIHTPCGAAAMAEMSLVHQIWHLMEAVKRVQAIDTNNEMVVTLHVDYGEDKERLALATSEEVSTFRQTVAEFIDQVGEVYDPALVGTLLQLPLDTHRRRTYRIDTGVFVAFWHERGRELWSHLFDKDPCPPKRIATDRAPEVLAPPSRVPMGTEGSEGGTGDARR